MTKDTAPLHIAIIKLTRWREFVLFTTILTWLGGLAAYQVHDARLDMRLFAVLIANLAAVAYAFMVNEIEDSDDDAHDPARGARNAVTSGEITPQMAWRVALVTALVAIVFYALCGLVPFLIGLLTVILAHLYSWKPVRLKARPLVDILSHALMLSMLLFLAPYYIYADEIGELWVLAAGTFLISAYGQLYNQARDYEADRAAGLHNSASILGKTVMDLLAKASVVGFVASIVISAFQEVFPLWLAIPFLISIPIGWFLGRDANHTDMRGHETTDPVGQIQRQALLIFNLTLLIWLIRALFF